MSALGQEWMVWQVLLSEPPFATLHEMDTVYDLNDLIDFQYSLVIRAERVRRRVSAQAAAHTESEDLN